MSGDYGALTPDEAVAYDADDALLEVKARLAKPQSTTRTVTTRSFTSSQKGDAYGLSNK